MNNMIERHQCSARVNGEGQWGAFHPHQCQKSAVVQEDGKWWCKVHSPSYKAAKESENRRIYDERWEKIHLEHSKIQKATMMYEALKKIASCESTVNGDVVSIAQKAVAEVEALDGQ